MSGAPGAPPPAPRGSLRRTLLAWLLLPLLVLVPLAAALVYGLALRPALDNLDRALTDTAAALQGILVVREGRAVLPLSAQTERALRTGLVDEVSFAVGDERGMLLGGDAELFAQRPSLQPGQWRFFDATLHRKAMRATAFGAPCGQALCPILVAESLGKRRAAEHAVAAAALGAGLLLAVPLVLLALLAVQRGLKPLQQASREIERRTLQRLEPIELSTMPREVASFGVALNDLFERLRIAAQAQRAFVDDASHQLRTPLATLLSDSAQALAQPHPEALKPTLERLHAAAERGARLAQQLLTLSRAEGAVRGAGVPHQAVDLAALVGEAANEWLRPSLAAGQDLGFDLASARVTGNPLLLHELVGNLVHNAMQHAGPGAHVTVRTRSAEGRAWLEVEDDGAGLPDEDLPRVWDRFRRGRGAQGHGTGLGLAIVRDIALAHDGQATLRQGAGGRGLVVTVSLPLVAPELSPVRPT